MLCAKLGKQVIPSQFYVKELPLPTVCSCRDLGIIINTDSPSLYINDTVIAVVWLF